MQHTNNMNELLKKGVYRLVHDKNKKLFIVYKNEEMLHGFEFEWDAQNYIDYHIGRDEVMENEKND